MTNEERLAERQWNLGERIENFSLNFWSSFLTILGVLLAAPIIGVDKQDVLVVKIFTLVYSALFIIVVLLIWRLYFIHTQYYEKLLSFHSGHSIDITELSNEAQRIKKERKKIESWIQDLLILAFSIFFVILCFKLFI